MSEPSTAREALIAEAIGNIGALIQDVASLVLVLNETHQDLLQANTCLLESLTRFEGRMAAIVEGAKVHAVKHIAARTDEAAKRYIDQQSRAMADAARFAFGAEVGAAMQRLQSMLEPYARIQARSWILGLIAIVAALAGSAITWFCLVHLGAARA